MSRQFQSLSEALRRDIIVPAYVCTYIPIVVVRTVDMLVIILAAITSHLRVAKVSDSMLM